MPFEMDHRYTRARKLLRTKAKSYAVDEYVATLMDYLDPKVDFEDENIARAEALYNNPYKRSILESHLLGGGVSPTSKSFDIPEEVLGAFTAYFFDTSILEDRLSKFEYVASLPDGEDKERKRWVLNLGKEFIDWRFGNPMQLEADEVLKRLLTDAYVMARHSMTNGTSTSKEVKESYRWATLAARIADVLSRRGDTDVEQMDLLEITALRPLEDLEDSVEIDALDIIRG